MLRTCLKVTTGLSILFVGLVAYIAQSANTFYQTWTPDLCVPSLNQSLNTDNACLQPFLKPLPNGKLPNVQLRVYLSASNSSERLGDLLYQVELNMAKKLEFRVNVTLPTSVLDNGTLFSHAFLLPLDFEGENPHSARWLVEQSGAATVYLPPAQNSFKFMSDEEKSKKPILGKPVAHLRTVVPLNGLSHAHSFFVDAVPAELNRLLVTDHDAAGNNFYYPVLYMDPLAFKAKDVVEIKPDVQEYEMTVHYRPAEVGKLHLLATILVMLRQMDDVDINAEYLDIVKDIVVDMSLYLIGLTCVITSLVLKFTCVL